MSGDDKWVPVGKITRLLPGVGATKVREYAADDLLRAIRLPSGHRRISVASAEALANVLTMDPGPERDAALEQLRRRNRGDTPSSDPTDS